MPAFFTGSSARKSCAEPALLPRQLLQIRVRRVGRAGAGIAGVLDHAVEPAIDIDNGTFARVAITAVGFTWSEAHAADVPRPPADGALHGLGTPHPRHAAR